MPVPGLGHCHGKKPRLALLGDENHIEEGGGVPTTASQLTWAEPPSHHATDHRCMREPDGGPQNHTMEPHLNYWPAELWAK